MSRVIVALLTLAALAGCVSYGPVDKSRAVATEGLAVATAESSVELADHGLAASEAPTGTPNTVEPLMPPVSLSNPPADAGRAFELCLVRGWVERNGIDVIAGLGRIDHANEAAHYVRLTGHEPELQSDQPAWIVQFRGDIRMPMSNTVYVDPACIVVRGGDGGFFGTGPVKDIGSGVTRTPQPVVAEPDRLLPPPQP